VNEESGGKEDPDSYLRKHSAQEFRAYLDARKVPLSGILWQILKKDRLIDTPERRAGFRADIGHLVNLIADKPTREEYRGHFQGLLQNIAGADNAGMRSAPGQRRGWRDGDGLTGADGRHYSFFEWRYLPRFYKEWGGEALRLGLHSVRRQPVEVFLATVIHHPDLLHKYIETLKALDIAEPSLDRFRSKLVRLANEEPELSGTGIWGQLVQDGLSDYLDGLSSRTHHLRFSLPSATEDMAENGLIHIIGILNEHAVRQELDQAGKRWAEEPTEENWQRFEALRDMTLEAESRRRDLDTAIPDSRSRV
jgi:DNA primase